MVLHTAKSYPWIFTTGGRGSVGRSPTKAKSRRFVEYCPTATEKNECRRCTVPSRSTPSKVSSSIPGTGSTPEAKCPSKACMPHPYRRSEESAPPPLSSCVTRKRANRSPTSLLGSRLVPRTSPTNQGGRLGSESPMAAMAAGVRQPLASRSPTTSVPGWMTDFARGPEESRRQC